MIDNMLGEDLNPEGKVPEKLIASLREGIAIVQMIFFKELKNVILAEHGDKSPEFVSMLCGALTNKVFGTENQEQRFVDFRTANKGLIEQHLLRLKDDLPQMRKAVTDAIRIQVLCDSHENDDTSQTLVDADNIGYLIQDRELPMPSTFMTIIRNLGEQHGLIIPPAQITPEDDQAMVH